MQTQWGVRSAQVDPVRFGDTHDQVDVRTPVRETLAGPQKPLLVAAPFGGRAHGQQPEGPHARARRLIIDNLPPLDPVSAANLPARHPD